MIDVEFAGKNFHLEFVNGHPWLVVGDVSIPLASHFDEERNVYCYLSAGTGRNYREIAVYEDGTVL